MRKRKGRKRPMGSRAPILIEARPSARRSVDFVHDQFSNGRRFRILNVIDVTKECLAGSPTPRSPGGAWLANWTRPSPGAAGRT